MSESNEANNACGTSSVTVTSANLTVSKNDSANAGTIAVDTAFTWVLSVANSGNGDATFLTNEVILRDGLPDTNVSYGAVTVTNQVNITGTIACSITTSILECTASGGNVNIGSTTGTFDVEITTTLQAFGTYDNPRSGQTCAVDPNNATAESDETDNTCSDTVLGRVFADLSITKDDGEIVAAPGASITYTIVATNSGPNDVSGVSVVDTFPPSFSVTYTSVAAGGATGNTASGSGNLNETLNMPSGSSVTYTATATIPSNTTGIISNTATISAVNVTDSNTANNSATDNDTRLVATADLSVTKTNNITAVSPGQSTSYTIVVTNNGPSNARDVVATDTLDANMTLVSTSGCAEDPAGVPTCSLGTIVSGSSATFTVNVTINNTASTSVTNSVSVSTSALNAAGNDTATDTDSVLDVDLTIAKSNTASNESLGSISNPSWDWTVVIANIGADTGTFIDGQVILTDQLPSSNVTYGTLAIGSITNITNSGNIVCNIDASSLLTCSASGADVTIGASTGTFTVTIPSSTSVAGTYTNVATTCQVDPNNVVLETDENNTCSSDNSVIVQEADLQATKTNNVTGAIVLGNTWTWTISLQNTEVGLAEFADGETIFSDSLPNTNIAYGAVNVNTAGAVNITNGANIACSINGSFVLTCIASGAIVTFLGNSSLDVSFDATPSDVGTFTNPRITDSCQIDPSASDNIREADETNNTCSDTVTVIAPNLTATKDDIAASGLADVNIPFTWVIRIENSGTADANFANGDVILLDRLPVGPTNVSYDPTVVVTNVTDTTGTIDCAIDSSYDLICTANGAVTIDSSTGEFDVQITTTLLVGGNFINPRETNGCIVDPNTTIPETLENDNTCQDTVFGQEADLIVTKTNNVSDGVDLGDSWVWTMSVLNQGVGDAIFQANAVILLDDLPDTNITYGAVSIVNSTGISGTGTIDCSETGFTITCTALGGSVIIADTTGGFDVTITSTPSLAGAYDNPRSGASCSVDSNNNAVESDNTNNDCQNTVIVNAPDLVVTKTNNTSGTIDLEDSFVWTLVIENQGASVATFSTSDVVLIDDMPTEATYNTVSVNYSAGIVGTITCNTPPNLNCTADGILTIPVGEMITLEIPTTAPNTALTLFNPRPTAGHL